MPARSHAVELLVGRIQLLIAPRVVFREAGAVAHQLPDGQWRRIARRQLHAREFRDPFRHRIFERQLAVISQLEDRERGEALGHRRNAERRRRRDGSRSSRGRGRRSKPTCARRPSITTPQTMPGIFSVGGVGPEDAIDVRQRRFQLLHAIGIGEARRRIGIARGERGAAEECGEDEQSHARSMAQKSGNRDPGAGIRI